MDRLAAELGEKTVTVECESELRMIKRWREAEIFQLNSNVNKRFKDKDGRGEIYSKSLTLLLSNGTSPFKFTNTRVCI